MASIRIQKVTKTNTSSGTNPTTIDGSLDKYDVTLSGGGTIACTIADLTLIDAGHTLIIECTSLSDATDMTLTFSSASWPTTQTINTVNDHGVYRWNGTKWDIISFSGTEMVAGIPLHLCTYIIPNVSSSYQRMIMPSDSTANQLWELKIPYDCYIYCLVTTSDDDPPQVAYSMQFYKGAVADTETLEGTVNTVSTGNEETTIGYAAISFSQGDVLTIHIRDDDTSTTGEEVIVNVYTLPA